jgi:hypothetical protein
MPVPQKHKSDEIAASEEMTCPKKVILHSGTQKRPAKQDDQ